jgi:DDE superfamily endonuclease
VYPEANKITIVEDNLSAHKLSALYEILPPLQARAIIERLEIVRTPKHGSWLNIAECELSVLLKFGLKKRTPDEKQLKSDAAAWAKYRNKKQKGVNWQFTSKDARIKLKKLYPSIID